MPRIYNGFNEPLDFCRKCYPTTEERARVKYGDGTGPDNRGNCFGYDAEHPDYDGENYKCELCKEPLTGRDDY